MLVHPPPPDSPPWKLMNEFVHAAILYCFANSEEKGLTNICSAQAGTEKQVGHWMGQGLEVVDRYSKTCYMVQAEMSSIQERLNNWELNQNLKNNCL